MAYDDSNIFAEILRGEAPAFSVYENEHCLAFLDAMPQSDGHTLVLPKATTIDLFDIEPDVLRTLIVAVQHVARGVRKAFEPDGIRLMQFNGSAAGQTVFHFHMHIMPCYEGKAARGHGRDFAESATLERHAAMIRAALEPA
jgi:histidine triad (HIT) family protein